MLKMLRQIASACVAPSAQLQVWLKRQVLLKRQVWLRWGVWRMMIGRGPQAFNRLGFLAPEFQALS